jgi:hypothetical protein
MEADQTLECVICKEDFVWSNHPVSHVWTVRVMKTISRSSI